MNSHHMYRLNRVISALLFLSLVAGCTGNASTPPTDPTPAPVDTSPTAEVTQASVNPTLELVADSNILYQDDFTNPATGWPEEKFDNYFIGYHEPEYYHIEITSANYKTTVLEPGKQIVDDAIIEGKVFTVSQKTAAEGDFIYGQVFRRSGDQYYAFTISPRTKKWFVLKSSPNALAVLAEGTEESIHNLDAEDILRVDAQGPNFSFYVNDRLVGQATDADYKSGEVGFYVQTLDAANVHIHFDSLSVKKFDSSPPPNPPVVMLYQDDFTNPASNWPEKKFDNYFIGYHEPEYYHIEVTSANYRTTVFEPEKQSFGDITIEAKTFTVSQKTAATGDFIYGPVFRRSGDQYYAFAISPRAKKWFMIKSSPNALVILAEGTEDSIHDLDVEDVLRVDAQGSKFSLHINEHLVGQVTDADYASGEVGFYVQTLDVANVHVHIDSISVRNFETPLVCNVTALTLNVRTGPGTSFPSDTYLSKDDVIVPIGRNSEGDWIKVKLENGEDLGWIFDSAGYISCSAAIDLLPVISP
ncbi:MAG: SH3 domain-containing protein [Anaerolineales bacterium]|nr:SH3 domain-containing protein [Anaerolineales bacterium]